MRAALLIMLLLLLLGSACLSAPSPSQAFGTLEVLAQAGPVCPVETVPADPACAPRPVAGAQVIVSPADGRDIVVASGATDATGKLGLSVPPGKYLVAAGEVDGLFGPAATVGVTVSAGETTSVTLEYDTGIR